MGLGTWLLDILYPPKCAFCGALLRETGDGVCPACRAALPRTGEKTVRCEFLTEVTAPFFYEGRVREAMLLFKFRGASARGRVFGRMMGEDLLRRGVKDVDCVTWVPLSRRRERKRGYDQARILAEAVAETLGAELLPLLEKVRDVPPQSLQAGAPERRANISGCYRADPVKAAGRRILLIDDIVTTGATLSECARVLMLAGAGSVRGAALACRRKD